MLSPPNARKRPLPTILEIHGGPTWAWNRSPNHDTKMWASAGYRVVRPNIRGSYNRGRDWIAPLLGDWGGVDAADCHAVLDHLVKAGLSDPKRLGCYGNSYGGFMVNWLVGTSDRFARRGLLERRRQPGRGLRELRLRRDVQRVRGPGRRR